MVPVPEQAALVAHVILDSPLPQLDHPFDYAVPQRLREDIAVGQKIVVPLRSGNRRTEAWVIGLSSTSSFAGNLADIESIVSEVVALTPELYELARTVADRQAGSAVDVLRLAIPPRYVRVEKDYLAKHDAGETSEHESPSPIRDQESRSGFRRSVRIRGSVAEIRPGVILPAWVISLAQAARDEFSAGRSTIFTLPDFRDVELLCTALEALELGEVAVRTDASLPGAQRWTNYLRILHEAPLIVIGNRSSVYAPVKNLGLIALWDATDESFTEPLAPYAHPRDVALIRQASSGCSLLFASHIESVETSRLEKLGYLEHQIVGVHDVQITASDLHSQVEEGQRSSRIPPAALVAARKAITNGPVLVQVARPGYAGTTRCSSCRERALCTSCHGPLALKTKSAAPSCRWCGRLAPDWACGNCHSTTLLAGQPGTEKTAEDLAKAFPGVLVHFSDGTKNLETLPASPALVIATAGTEPLVTGGYRAVIVVDGESARSREDLDTDTTALRSWMNAVSLAAPEAPVFIAGSGPVLGRVVESDSFEEFASNALREREALSLPPATRVAVVTGSRQAIANVEKELVELPHRGVMGPVPAPEDASRLIITFDYKDGAVVAKKLRALVLQTAITNRKPAGVAGAKARVLRLNVRIDDFAMRGIG